MSQKLNKYLSLFQPIQFGDLQLKNRFVVAPLTRMRAQKNGVPTDLMVQYYSQRHQYGLIFTECSQISPLSNPYPGSGGIYSEEQIQGWQKVTQKVHEKGGLIMIEIWHCGRAVNPDQIDGNTPIAPSAIAINGLNYFTKDPYPIPKELSTQEVKEVVQQYKQAAINAKRAGFDGVHIHGGNGFLIDQFLKDASNKRTDEYGGSIENRSKFALEIIDACIEVFGAGRVGIRLAPTARFNDIYDSNPLELYKYLLKEIEKRNIAFVELKRHGKQDSGKKNDGKIDPNEQIPDFFLTLRKFYNGNIIGNDGISIDEAEQLISDGLTQAVSFGSLSIVNPDLPNKILKGYQINYNFDYSTYYFGEEKGYIDIPFAE